MSTLTKVLIALGVALLVVATSGFFRFVLIAALAFAFVSGYGSKLGSLMSNGSNGVSEKGGGNYYAY